MSEKSTPQANSTPKIIANHSDDIKRVKALADYCLEVEFNDGVSGKVFLKGLIFSPDAGVFAVLKDESLFNQVYVHLGVTTWPGELDLAPDAMYSAFQKSGEWVLG